MIIEVESTLLALSAGCMMCALWEAILPSKLAKRCPQPMPCCGEAYLAAMKASEMYLKEAIQRLQRAPHQKPEPPPGMQVKPGVASEPKPKPKNASRRK